MIFEVVDLLERRMGTWLFIAAALGGVMLYQRGRADGAETPFEKLALPRVARAR